VERRILRFFQPPDEAAKGRGGDATATELEDALNVSAKATHRQPCQCDPRLVLGALYDDGPVSRAEVARRSLTVVRDEARGLPLRLGPEERILAVMPLPVDHTPADTSSTVPPVHAAALRTALVGRLEPSGRLPVPLGDLYPVGHGL
jgi:hypothetical protein